MEAKKDRGRFTLRLNEKDPAHAEVIRLLEQQDPHSKGRFIANAILHYVRCSETPDIAVQQIPDRAAIETIVLDILRQQKYSAEQEGEWTHPVEDQEELAQKKSVLQPVPVIDESKESDIDEDVRSMIKGTLSAFRFNS